MALEWADCGYLIDITVKDGGILRGIRVYYPSDPGVQCGGGDFCTSRWRYRKGYARNVIDRQQWNNDGPRLLSVPRLNGSNLARH